MRREREYIITGHAVDRFRQRVVQIDRRAARSAIYALAVSGKRRTRPRHWMKTSGRHDPGTVYIYHPDFPNIGLVVRDDTVVTVMERHSSKLWRVDEAPDGHEGRGARRGVRRRDHGRQPHGACTRVEDYEAGCEDV